MNEIPIINPDCSASATKEEFESWLKSMMSYRRPVKTPPVVVSTKYYKIAESHFGEEWCKEHLIASRELQQTEIITEPSDRSKGGMS